MKKRALLLVSLMAMLFPAQGMMKYAKRGKDSLKKSFNKHPKKYTILGFACATGIGGYLGFTIKSPQNNIQDTEKNDTPFHFDCQEHGLKIAKNTHELYLAILNMPPEKESLEDTEREKQFKTITAYSITDIPVELLAQATKDKKLQRKLIQFYYINGAPASSSSVSEEHKKLWHSIFSNYTLENIYEMLYSEAKTEQIAQAIDPYLACDLIKIKQRWQHLCAQKSNLNADSETTNSSYHTFAKEHDITIPSWIEVKVDASKKCVTTEGINIILDEQTAKQAEKLLLGLARGLNHILLGHDISRLHTALYLKVDCQDQLSVDNFNIIGRNLMHHEVITRDIAMCLMSEQACNTAITQLRKLRTDAYRAATDPEVTRTIPGNVHIIQNDEDFRMVGEDDKNPSHLTRIQIMKRVLKEKEMANKGCILYPLFKQLGTSKWDCSVEEM